MNHSTNQVLDLVFLHGELGKLTGSVVGCFVVCLVGWLVCGLVCGLVGGWVGWLVGWLVTVILYCKSTGAEVNKPRAILATTLDWQLCWTLSCLVCLLDNL